MQKNVSRRQEAEMLGFPLLTPIIYIGIAQYEKNNNFLLIFCPECFIFHKIVLSLHRFSRSTHS